MILSNQSIRYYARNGLICPFNEEQIYAGMTYGLSGAGYDIRIDQDITLYPVTLWNLFLNGIGIKRPSFSLASSMEKFSIPDNLMMFVVDKSTWARRGLAVQNTTAEPGWRGSLTLELSNHSSNVLRIRRGTPIAQMIFHKLDVPTEKSYSGKYQDQREGPQSAILM